MRLIKWALVLALAVALASGAACTRAREEVSTRSPAGEEGALPPQASGTAELKSEREAESGGTRYGHDYMSVLQESDRIAMTVASPQDRMVIRNAALELRVEDVGKALAELRRAVAASNAEIFDLSVSDPTEGASAQEARRDGPTHASITIRVAARDLEALTETLAKLGTVISQSESASDVTEQAIDLEARLKNLRAEEVRLRSFLDRAVKIDDLLAVERELMRVRGEIEAMDASLTNLKRQVARATLVVTMSEPSSVVGPESPLFGLREAFAEGVRGAIEVLKVMVTFVVASAPLVLVILVVVWGVASMARRRRARRSRAVDVGEDTTEA